MKKIIHITIFIAITQCLDAQFSGVFKDSTFSRLENNLAILAFNDDLRGTFQWQKSSDLLIWTDIDPNITGNAIALLPEQTEYYRLRINEGNCLPIYTDTAKVYSQSTTVFEYQAEGITISDLIASGITISELFNASVMVGTLEQNGVDSTELVNAGLIGTVTDTMGNIYKWIRIGEQYWMAENLKTTKYKNGSAIPLVTDNSAWGMLYTPGYCWYNNDSTNYAQTYGALYNWHTVNTGNLCPTGWHMPAYAEWITLTAYLGGRGVAGGKLKETDTGHWNSTYTLATNETGFTALPGGDRSIDVGYLSIRLYGYWWSATEDDNEPMDARYLSMSYDDTWLNVSSSLYKEWGMSVRCLRD